MDEKLTEFAQVFLLQGWSEFVPFEEFLGFFVEEGVLEAKVLILFDERLD